MKARLAHRVSSVVAEKGAVPRALSARGFRSYDINISTLAERREGRKEKEAERKSEVGAGRAGRRVTESSASQPAVPVARLLARSPRGSQCYLTGGIKLSKEERAYFA